MIAGIDWGGQKNEFLINPRMPLSEAERLQALLAKASSLSSHVFILTSGSTAASSHDHKWVALSKSAILAGAAAANLHLQSDRKDIWLSALPEFHIGGLAIRARAELTGAQVVRDESSTSVWSPLEFVSTVQKSRATLASLVPTQLYDLVRANLSAPPSLRALLVGGGALSTQLYLAARAMGWPILPTYGMTEMASQVATASLMPLMETTPSELPPLYLLEHIQGRVIEDRLHLRGNSMLTGYLFQQNNEIQFIDPKNAEGWFATEDLARLEQRSLTIQGRLSDRIKIGGELTHLGRLRMILEEEALSQNLDPATITLVAKADDRLENVIELLVAESVTEIQLRALATRFATRVMPFERIRSIRRLTEIPRTDLGKLKLSAIQR